MQAYWALAGALSEHSLCQVAKALRGRLLSEQTRGLRGEDSSLAVAKSMKATGIHRVRTLRSVEQCRAPVLLQLIVVWLLPSACILHLHRQ